MLDSLKDFATVVEHGSINQAARSLNMSQPALSRKISTLEQEIGAQLFLRKGKKLVLTRIGELAYEYALETRSIEQRFLQTLAENQPETTISLTIGASLTTLQSTLPDLIAAMNDQKLPLEINAVTGKTHEIVKLVTESKADLGLIASDIQHPDLTCHPLFTDHLVLVLPRRHPLQYNPDQWHIRNLQHLPMILFSRGTWYRILMDELFQNYSIHPDIRMEIDSFEAILRLISTCNMATLLPFSYLRPSIVEDNKLVLVHLDELKRATRTTSIIYGKNNNLPPSVKDMIIKTATQLCARYAEVNGERNLY